MSSFRRSDFAIAAAIFVFAVLVSPIGIRFGTGRLDLSPRVNILSLTFDLFLMTLAGAVLTSGRARRVFLHLLVWTIPLALFAVIVPTLWKSYPFFTLTLLAAMQSIPEHLYEAARVDGATAWQRFVHITWPGIRSRIPKSS